MISMPIRKTRTRPAGCNNPEAGIGRYPGLVQIWVYLCRFGDIARFPMLAVAKRSLSSRPSCDHEDIETRSLPRSEFITKRKN
jgi:hypothetical protein